MASPTNVIRNNDAGDPKVAPVDMKLEVIVIPVSDVERAEQFGVTAWSPSASLMRQPGGSRRPTRWPCQECRRRSQSQPRIGGIGVAPLASRAGHSYHRRAQAFSTAGQSRKLRTDALIKSSKDA